MNTVYGSQFAVHGSRAGFTMVELIIAIAITTLTLAGVYTTFVVQQRSFSAQDQVAETQVTSKIALDILIDDIRNSGFGYPGDENPSINGYSAVVTPTDNGLNGGPDSVTLVGGFRQVATLDTPVVTGQDTITIQYLVGATSLNLSNRQYITIDGAEYAEITACTLLTNNCLDGTANPLTLDRPIGRDFSAGRPVYLVEDIMYMVSSQGLEQFSGASGQTTVVASNIDDLQFAYAVDTNNDGLIDDQNANNVLDPGDYLTPPLPANSKILAIRASLLASTRADYADPNLEPSTKPYFQNGIVLENNTTADTDRLRRRMWSMQIKLRNPG